MIHYRPNQKRSVLWSMAMTQGNYEVAAVVAWSEVHMMLSKKWGAGSFGSGLLLYLYTKDGE